MEYILGIDYGIKKIGISISDMDSKIPQPYKVIRESVGEKAVEKICKIAYDLKIKTLVVGISEGRSADSAKAFANQLGRKNKYFNIILQDETLSTYDAKRYSFEAGLGKKKRKNMEDAYAACIILENYFLSN